jgi:undecaprenyl diphosphate synthase
MKASNKRNHLVNDKMNAIKLLNTENLPMHIGIIMDGNRRWSKNHNKSIEYGYKIGFDVLKEVLGFAEDIGIEIITVYAFSTENWKRPQKEIDFLMSYFLQKLRSFTNDFKGENIQVKIIGDKSKLSNEIQSEVSVLEGITSAKSGLLLNVAINYGGRQGIVNAAKEVIKLVEVGTINIEDINEDMITNALYASVDLDLIIRTSGEKRLSNFLLWQAKNSLFYVIDKHWPDFTYMDLVNAIILFQNSNPRISE